MLVVASRGVGVYALRFVLFDECIVFSRCAFLVLMSLSRIFCDVLL